MSHRVRDGIVGCVCFALLWTLCDFGFTQDSIQETLRLDDQTVAVQTTPWQEIDAGSTVDLHGLHVPSGDVVWVCGEEGAVLRSINGGKDWKNRPIKDEAYPNGPPLCDIHAFDDATAIAISSAVPAKIYRTTNGGIRWKTILEYPGDVAFCGLSFWDQQRGVVIGNGSDGRVLMLRSTDGGVIWKRIQADHRPQVNPDEVVLLGGGANMQAVGEQMLVVGLGGAEGVKENSRVLISTDYCRSWVTGSAPVRRSKVGGIFSVYFTSPQNGVVLGGDASKPETRDQIYAVTSNGGRTWGIPNPAAPPSGFRSSIARFIDGKEVKLVAVGSTGTDLSTDLGNRWRKVSDKGFHAVEFDPEGRVGFAVGDQGRVARWIPAAVKSTSK